MRTQASQLRFDARVLRVDYIRCRAKTEEDLSAGYLTDLGHPARLSLIISATLQPGRTPIKCAARNDHLSHEKSCSLK